MLRAGEQSAKWTDRRNKAHRADRVGPPLPQNNLDHDPQLDDYIKPFITDLEPLLQWVPVGGYECPNVHLQVHDLLQSAARSKG